MFKKLFGSIGKGSPAASAPAKPPLDGPYKDDGINFIYQLLFCDRLHLFKEHRQGPLAPPWSILFSSPPDLPAISKIAEDTHQESRVRMLAFNLLRASRKPVLPKQHLGTIIEIPLKDGLDTLAVFADGTARYINQSGKTLVVEASPNPFTQEINSVLDASKPVVMAIGPWNKPRLPSPKAGDIRLTFLVSDGLYFGQGPFELVQKEQMAAPLIVAATALLLKLVEISMK